MPTSELLLKDVIEIKEDVHAGDFKIELSQGFSETDARVAEYVVTEQLQRAFRQALDLVAGCVRSGNSEAAYLHGSFGSGKSHFLTVLHAVLNNHPSVRTKPRLVEVVAPHDEWLRRSRFLMVPYHLVGSADLDSALLGGYVHTVRELHPDKPLPPSTGPTRCSPTPAPSGSSSATTPSSCSGSARAPRPSRRARPCPRRPTRTT